MSSTLELKDAGNAAFSKGNMAVAIEKYTEAVASLHSGTKEIQKGGEMGDLYATCLSNRAACRLRLAKNHAATSKKSTTSQKDDDNITVEAKYCIDDCDSVIDIRPGHVKAIYRRAQAKLLLGDASGATLDLTKLIHIDPNNTDAVTLLREARSIVAKDHQGISESVRLLRLLRTKLTEYQSKSHNNNGTDSSHLKTFLKETVSLMRALASLCSEDASHARDFAKNDGIVTVCSIGQQWGTHDVEGKPVIGWMLSTLCAACEHAPVATTYISLEPISCISPTGLVSMDQILDELVVSTSSNASSTVTNIQSIAQLSLSSLCSLVDAEQWGIPISTAALTSIMRILRAQPLYSSDGRASAAPTIPPPPPVVAADSTPLTSNESRVEELPTAEEEAEQQRLLEQAEAAKKADADPRHFLPHHSIRDVVRACKRAIATLHTELLVLGCDALVALYGDCEDYFTPMPIIDTRMESLEQRKYRFLKKRIVSTRASTFALVSLTEENVLDAIISALDSTEPLQRARAIPCFGRLINAIIDPNVAIEAAKAREQKKKNKEKNNSSTTSEIPIEEDILLKSYFNTYISLSNEAGTDLPSVQNMKRRAVITAALLTVRPPLGIWALQSAGGMPQTLALVSTRDIRCQDIAAEVMCLAAAVDGGQELLALALSSGAIHELLKSGNPGIRAAAASTITKLSLKAKALEEDTPEVSAVLNAALDVIKVHLKSTDASNSLKEKTKGGEGSKVDKTAISSSLLPSMSGLSLTPMTQSLEKSVLNANSIASVERAVEVIAAMSGKTHVKEELVHGSYRVQAAIKTILSLDLDARSSAAYGISHILALLTVTNGELHKIALAEKDITPDQYAKLQELQRIKGVKDENGNVIEEKKELIDNDTDSQCRIRIKNIVQNGGFSCLVRLLTFGSSQTRDYASRALRQMCVEESVRGLFIQQGALKACCDIIAAHNTSSNNAAAAKTENGNNAPPTAVTRREAAHAVAKALVTTNPTLLQEHARLGTIQPLLYLAKDVDSTNLQQFEALLSLTNIVSLGEAEQNKFIKEKGVSHAHYLMFSDHLMVRRAACEIFCNIPTCDPLLAMMAVPEKVRLWVGLLEEYCSSIEESQTSTDDNNDDNDNTEKFLIARACTGTLAISANEPSVAKALIQEDVGSVIAKLLQCGQIEIIHRALVLIIAMVDADGISAGMHLLESKCVPGIAVAHEIIRSSPDLMALAKQAAGALSKAIKE